MELLLELLAVLAALAWDAASALTMLARLEKLLELVMPVKMLSLDPSEFSVESVFTMLMLFCSCDMTTSIW